MKAEAGAVSVSSTRWRVVGLVLGPVVALQFLPAAAYLVQADGTLRAASTDYAQAYLGIGGGLLIVLGFCTLAYGVLISIDCAVNLVPRCVRVANVRSVCLAWPMIDGVTTVAGRRRLIPALHLINGDVVPIRMAARTPPGSVIASSAALTLISTALTKRSPGQSSWLLPAGGKIVRGRLMRSR